MSQATKYKQNQKEQCLLHTLCMRNFITNCWWKWQLSRALQMPVGLLGRLLSLQWSHLWSELFLSLYVILTTNVIFFFWSRPSDFKSSFKPRKGHFPTVQFSERLPSPTENHSPGVKQPHARTSGPIGRSQKSSHWSFFLSSQTWKCTVLKRVASLCTHEFF